MTIGSPVVNGRPNWLRKLVPRYRLAAARVVRTSGPAVKHVIAPISQHSIYAYRRSSDTGMLVLLRRKHN